jgi:F420-non-reducing hydrogenase small subunit
MSKLKIAFYWLASCGGCEIALLDTDEVILDVAAIADIVFMPLAVDGKWDDIRKFADSEIDITFINGAVRNNENIHEIELLRRKSKLIVAFGQCSTSGGVIGLGNDFNRDDLIKYVYSEAPSVVNPDPELFTPKQEYQITDEIKLTLPKLTEYVHSIDEYIDVDYYLPGCPPPVPTVIDAIIAIKENNLPPKGSYIGTFKSVCETCPKTRNERREIKITKFKRPHEIIPGELDENQCLLEQGIICLGPITRGACNGACLDVHMPCRGCLGNTPDTRDPAAKMISVISQFSAEMTEEEVNALIDSVIDPVGLFYRFSFPKGLIKHSMYKEV